MSDEAKYLPGAYNVAATGDGASGYTSMSTRLPIDVDAMKHRLAEYERRYRRPSADLHKAFRWRRVETDDEREWAMLYDTLKMIGAVPATKEDANE